MKRLLVCVALLLAMVRLEAATTKFSDNFTNTGADENCDAQVNHSGTAGGNVGASPFWAEMLDSGGTVSCIARGADTAQFSPSDTGDRVIWVATPNPALSSADYDVSLTFANMSTQPDDDHVCVFGRLADSTHGYGACMDYDVAPQTLSIVELNGSNSGLVPLTTTTLTVVATDIMKLSMRGDTLKLWINGTQRLCVVDATQTATGQGGFGQGNFITAGGDVNSGFEYDNFLIEDATGDGGDDNCGAGVVGPPVGGRLLGRIGR